MSRSRKGEERLAAPWISLAVLALVVLGICGWILRPQIPGRPSGQAQIDLAEDLVRLGDNAFAAWNQTRRGGNTGQAQADRDKALSIYTRAMDSYDDALEPFRDPDTGDLPPEYEGYEERLQHVALRIVDLEKG